MRLFSPDSTHWYTCHGTPLHTVKGANGEYRPTTLRDAKKWRVLPSVTNIIGIIQKEGISQWKMNHCVEAALTLPRRPGEDLGAFAQRVAEEAEQAMSKSAEFGTEFHAGAQRVAEMRMTTFTTPTRPTVRNASRKSAKAFFPALDGSR